MNQSAHLYRLQVIDLEIDKIQARINEILNQIETDETIQSAHQMLEEKTQELQKTHTKLRSAEETVKSFQIKLQTNDANLYNGKIANPKELQDLQKENGMLKRRLVELEDEQLEIMIIYEEAEAALNTVKGSLTRVEAEAVERHAHLRGEQSKLESQKERLLIEKNALSGSIQPENLQRYSDLRIRKSRIAISRVEDNACTVCGSSIRPATIQEARLPDKMATCPSCGRILYIQ